MKVSEAVRARIEGLGGSFGPNDNIAHHLEPGEIEGLQKEVEAIAERLLDALVIDRRNHNVAETPKRLAKMFLREVFAGRYAERPRVASFPNAGKLDEIFVVGPITVRSACSHHLVPIIGKAWVGVIPGEKVIGLSKYHRLAEWVLARPQIQEEATIQLADEIERESEPHGLAVLVRAQHLCATWRGVRDTGSEMTTSVMRGRFRWDATARNELMNLLRANGF